MAHDTRLTAYGERTAGSLDEAADPDFTEYGSTPSMAKRDYSLPEDIPLFLCNDAAEPGQRGFGNGGESDFDQAGIRSQYIKAGLLVATGLAIAVAILSVENPGELLASAKASLTGVQTSVTPKAVSAPMVAARPASAQPAPATPSTTSLAALPPPEQTAPTRDEIALALRAAYQSQQEIRPPAAAPPARQLGGGELAALLKRATGLIAIGDIAAARLLLERAADAQDASGALLLAQTYDPAVLGTPDARSITPDPAKARDWYRKAARLGSQDAQLRLSQMQN